MKAWRKKVAAPRHGYYQRVKAENKVFSSKCFPPGYKRMENFNRWRQIYKWMRKHWHKCNYDMIEKLFEEG